MADDTLSVPLFAGGVTLPSLHGHVRFEHVHFAYKPVQDAVVAQTDSGSEQQAVVR